MFKFLRDKLKSTISKISKKIEKEGKEEVIEVEKPEPKPKEKKEIPKETREEKAEVKEEPVKKGFFGKLKERFAGKEEKPEIKEEVKEVPKEETAVEKKEVKVEKPKPQVEEKPKPVKEEAKAEEKKQEPKPKLEEKKEEPKPKPEPLVEEKPKEEPKPEKEEPEEPVKKGFFGKLKERVVTKKINESQFEDLFWTLEVALLENNVATEVIEKIKEDLKRELVEKPIRRSKIEKTIQESLKKSIEELFDVESFDIFKKIKQKKPFVMCFVGINGSGKTTTIAKVARLLLDNNKKVVLAAADTFRAAAIDQLQIHADKLGVRLIKHDYGSDPAAVAFDAIKHAEAKNIDVVLIDTAGRMHANSNLMEEMSKIVRVAKPDLKIFVGESITGNDCVEQAKKFDETVGIDAIILSKADVDEKGGAAVSISYVTKKPIIFIGVGQGYKDLKEFDSEIVLKNLGLES